MINTFLKLLVIVTLLSSCAGETAYTPKDLSLMTKEQVIEMAKNKTFPTPANVVYKDPKGAILSLDSLGKIAEPNDYYQSYYRDAEGVIKEVIVKKASPEEKAFNEKVLKIFNGLE